MQPIRSTHGVNRQGQKRTLRQSRVSYTFKPSMKVLWPRIASDIAQKKLVVHTLDLMVSCDAVMHNDVFNQLSRMK